MSLRIENARPDQTGLILDFIRKLADYDQMAHKVAATEEGLRHWLFGDKSVADVVIAYWDAAPVGFALFYPTISTFSGSPGLYLEDLYVEPDHRGHGVGKALLAYLARVATDRGYGRLEWSVLTWNQPAIGFYERLGAVPRNEWYVYRLSGDALAKLAAGPR
ncbi:MAG: GNAT family N-acetyltransferase [Bryobacteraceae bacterium]